jgi:hypothetical protein
MSALEYDDADTAFRIFYTIHIENNFKPWPDDAKKIEPYKAFILKHLLTAIRNRILDTPGDRWLVEFKTIIFGMYTLGIKWPELNTIENSLVAEIKREHNLLESSWPKRFESSDSARYFNHLTNAVEAFNEDVDDEANLNIWHISSIYENLIKLGMISEPLPYRADILNRYKPIIIKIILQVIKHDVLDDWMDTSKGELAMVNGLRKLGVTWPELDIIEKSLKADIKKDDQLDESKLSIPDNSKLKKFRKILNYGNWPVVMQALQNKHCDVNRLPVIKNLLDEYKNSIIKSLLESMRHQAFDVILHEIDIMRSINIAWPELKAIRRNARYELNKHKNIDEATFISTKKETNLENIKYFLNWNRISTACDILRDGKMTIRNYKGLGKILNEFETQILNTITYYIDDTTYHGLAITCATAIQDTGVKWPQLYKMIESRKSRLVERLLRCIKGEYYHDTAVSAHNLQKLHVTWPELDIILNSLKHNAKTLSDIDESEEPTEKMKENLQHAFIAMLNNEDYNLIANAFERFNVNTSNSPELMRKVTREKQYILHRLDINLDDININYINMGCYIIKNFRLAGLDWPEFTTLLEDKKHELIKRILKRILTSVDISQTTRWLILNVTQLRTVVDWPELDVIEKSLRHESDKTSLDEVDYRKADPSTYSRADKIRFTTNSIKGQELGGVAYYIRQWNLTAAEYPEVLEAFEANKFRVIKFLLYMVKTFITNKREQIDILNTIKYFIVFGLTWPELRIVQKSLTAL